MATKVVWELPNGSKVTLGFICQAPDGYWFNPKMPHRKPSRKRYKTPDACIPSWARKGWIVED